MRRACREERPLEEVEEVEEAGRVILWEDIPLLDMPPPAPREIADEQPEGVPVAAVNPEGMIGPQQPINLAEAENRPFHHNGRCLAGEAEMESIERQLDEAYPNEMKIFTIMIVSAIILLLFIGNTLNVLSYELGWRGNRTENAPTPATDMVLNVSIPTTTTIFNVASSDYNATTSTNDLSFNDTDKNI